MEPTGIAALVAELTDARERLRSIAGRVAIAADSSPRREASGWEGLASDAYQSALDHLAREIEGARELLRSAGDLFGAALFELAGHD
ncbi:MAG TPA: hypothetical protein VGF80_06640 [Galbitalea sp.]